MMKKTSMKMILNRDSGGADLHNLGSEITSWMVNPGRANRTFFTVVGILVTLAIVAWPILRDFLPLLKMIPAILLYGLIFFIAPLVRRFNNQGKKQEWTLFKNGYRVRYLSRQNSGESKTGYWKEYKTCTVESSGIKLIPVQPFARTTRMPVPVNVMGIYSIVRECISLAQTQELEKQGPIPAKPNRRSNWKSL